MRTRFNGQVSSSRVTDALIMDLADVKTIRKCVEGATVNDVIVAIVGGGLRKYLHSKDELPETSLSCGAPINMRSERNSESQGNQVSQMMISMATDLDDPLARLRAVHQSAQQAKAYSDTMGTSVIMDVSEMMIPRVMGWGMKAASFAAANAEVPMPMHVVISNVPGPQFPLYLAGARLHMIMGMGPLLHMMGLFHGVFSAVGKITINFLSCREMLPDPEVYRECLQASFDELQTAAKQARPTTSGKAASKARGKSRARPKTKARAKTTSSSKPKARPKAKAQR